MATKEEILEILKDARGLSSKGPDFLTFRVANAWFSALKDIPEHIINQAVDKLSGQKEFPSLAKIYEVCQSKMNFEKWQKDEEEFKNRASPKDKYIKQILAHPKVKEFRYQDKLNDKGYYIHFHQQLSFLPLEKLEYYAQHVDELFELLLPKASGWI